MDGYIADKDGNLDWLDSVPNPKQSDMGYTIFMDGIDALVMGRTTFDTVCNFDVDWPYTKPVFVLSNALAKIPEDYKNKAYLVKGKLTDVVKSLNDKGYNNLYIDGGSTIQGFLKEDLIDEIISTTIPVLLGGGSSLFADLPQRISFGLVKSEVH